jgi:hypothetical protein
LELADEQSADYRTDQAVKTPDRCSGEGKHENLGHKRRVKQRFGIRQHQASSEGSNGGSEGPTKLQRPAHVNSDKPARFKV